MEKLIVIRGNGFLTSIDPSEKKSTDTVINKVHEKNVEATIHGGRKIKTK